MEALGQGGDGSEAWMLTKHRRYPDKPTLDLWENIDSRAAGLFPLQVISFDLWARGIEEMVTALRP